jgi:hypothetical protein
MKTPYALIIFVLFLLCQSCSKNNSPQKTVRTDTLNLSVAYADTSRNPPPNFELLIREPGGKLLLDTLAPVNTPVVAALSTSSMLVNVTTIYMGTHDTAFTVTSYLGVDPSDWQTFPINNAFVVLSPRPPSSTRQTYVEHIPGYPPPIFNYNYVWFSYADIPVFFPAINQYNSGILLNGPFAGSNYLYSFIPSLGLYNFHVQNWVNGTDTVDLSHMDTMRQVNFPRPSQYGKCYCLLDGIMDTTDYSKSVMLYYSPFTPTTPDLEYPAKYVQKFQLHATFLAPDNTQVTYYSYGSTISPDFLFPDPSTYTITSYQSDNFSIKFNNLSPTFYDTQWKSAKINFYIYSSPDSGVQHPQTLLTSLGSQKLKSQAITPPTPSSMSFETVEGMNYAQFLSYSSSPSLITTRRVSSAVRLLKTF